MTAAQVARLVFLREWFTASDRTYPIAYHIAMVLQSTLAVVVACVPALKPFSKHAKQSEAHERFEIH